MDAGTKRMLLDAEIGKILTDWMDNRGLYQKDIAMKLGISAPFLNQMLKGRVSIPKERLNEIIDIIKLSPGCIEKIESISNKKNSPFDEIRETSAPYVSDKMNVKKESSSQETEESILNNPDLTSDQKKKMILMLKEMELENKLSKSE